MRGFRALVFRLGGRSVGEAGQVVLAPGRVEVLLDPALGVGAEPAPVESSWSGGSDRSAEGPSGASAEAQGSKSSWTLPRRFDVRRVGFDGRGVEIAWDAGGRRAAPPVLHPAEAEEVLRALEAGHPESVAAVRATDGGRRRSRRLAFLALVLVALAPLLLVASLLVNLGPLAGLVASQVSVERERQLGELVFAQMRPGLRIREEGPEVERVRRLGALLTEGTRHRFDFFVAEDPSVNAFAIPGGIIVVHTGLLERVEREEELAGVLAHEVAHVEERHSLEGIVKSLGLSAASALLFGDVAGGVAARSAEELLALSFSRAAEREADTAGFERLMAADIDPSGLADFFGKLDDGGGGAILRTHPPSKERAARIREMRSALKDRTFPPLGPRLSAGGANSP